MDHDHITGTVRGLLCRVCNIGLGHFKDSRLHLKKAMEYLDKHDVNSGNHSGLQCLPPTEEF